ncbi:MAG: flavin reductase (DIM6/NTAB) family NADH-FMN oxidoreductase RutF [Alphaproteobacteria bacterium]|jgi:flavin reductase (DIM6/NTAB) family NADH-FMN oxidoreductase RutF
MFYETAANNHGLPRDPYKALIVPRPIGWISTVSKDGVCNIAPYSFFNAISEKPHYVIFGSATAKDSVRNIEETGEFVCSLSTYELREEMNVTSAGVPHGVDEYPLSGLTAVKSTMVKPPRVKESPAALECKHWKTIELPPAEPGGKHGSFAVIGLVVGIYIDDAALKDGFVDTAAMQPLSRLGYMDYSWVSGDTMVTINRPEVAPDGTVKG